MDASAQWPLPDSPYDFFASTRMLRTGKRDPTVRREPDGLWRTAHTPQGPATVRIWVRPDHVEAHGWGEGAQAAVDQVPDWIGLAEDPWVFPAHPRLDPIARDFRGLRASNTHDVFEGVVNAILQQLVTWNEAAMTWRRLCEAANQPAPGPTDMLLSPTGQDLRRLGTDRIQGAGVGRQRARTLMEAARVAHVFKRVAALPTPDAQALLHKIRGIGPWTSANVLGMRLGRPEPLLLGDYHLPNTIAWALAGEQRGTEDRMLELLAPFEGVAFRVVRVLMAANIQAPRRGAKRSWGHRR